MQGTLWLGVDYIGKQNAVPTILGRLVSSSRKNMSIFEDTVRQAYSLDSLQMMCILTAAIFTRNVSRVSKTRTRKYAERAICTASPNWAGDFAANRIHFDFGSCN